MLGLFYLTGFCVYLLCGIIFAIWRYRKCVRRKKLFSFLAFMIFMLLPFTDYFIQLSLVQIRTIFGPPLQMINNVIESPISVYWEDNVWPGFDEYGRNWMVKNYLDGKHLQILAMNGDDGHIYLYRYNVKGFEQYKNRDELPPMNYEVKFNKLSLFFFEHPFLWADKIEIISTQDKEIIDYSERYCGYGWWLGYYPIGNFAKGYVKGDVRVYEFVHNVLFSYTKLLGVNIARSRDLLEKSHYRLIQ